MEFNLSAFDYSQSMPISSICSTKDKIIEFCSSISYNQNFYAPAVLIAISLISMAIYSFMAYNRDKEIFDNWPELKFILVCDSFFTISYLCQISFFIWLFFLRG